MSSSYGVDRFFNATAASFVISCVFAKWGPFCIRRVEGESMRPTLNPQLPRQLSDDIVLARRVPSTHPGHIVHFRGKVVLVGDPRDDGKTTLIKRLRGVQTDIVKPRARPGCPERETLRVPDRSVWIESDAGPGYVDSNTLGPIDIDLVVGVARWIIWPPERMGRVS